MRPSTSTRGRKVRHVAASKEIQGSNSIGRRSDASDPLVHPLDVDRILGDGDHVRDHLAAAGAQARVDFSPVMTIYGVATLAGGVHLSAPGRLVITIAPWAM